MKEVIYYPTFEVGNSNWLKFALLYLDKLDPIIPPSGQVELSDQFRRLQWETDLIDIHPPSYDEGSAATRDSLEHIEKILRNPERYNDLFSHGFLQMWRNPNRQRARLFKDKYTDAWEHFCVKEGLGRRTDRGLLVNDELGDVYMTILAHVIADGRGISPMTDDRTLDRLAVFTRAPATPDEAEMQTAQAVIELELPSNLSEIPIASIIEHRNKPEFKDKQAAFHKSLGDFIAGKENGKPGYFSESMGSAWGDFRDDILRVGTGVLGFSLGVWLLVGSGPVGTLKAASQIVGGLSLVAGSTIAIKNTWRNTETKRWTRKYLAELNRIR